VLPHDSSSSSSSSSGALLGAAAAPQHAAARRRLWSASAGAGAAGAAAQSQSGQLLHNASAHSRSLQQQQQAAPSCALLAALRANPQAKSFAALAARARAQAAICDARRTMALLVPTDDAFDSYLSRRKLSLQVLLASRPNTLGLVMYHIVTGACFFVAGARVCFRRLVVWCGCWRRGGGQLSRAAAGAPAAMLC
jgi:uncharacterized surface protein with fasciclin (FAS1) repeats